MIHGSRSSTSSSSGSSGNSSNIDRDWVFRLVEHIIGGLKTHFGCQDTQLPGRAGAENVKINNY